LLIHVGLLPTDILNRIKTDLGIPSRFKRTRSRSSEAESIRGNLTNTHQLVSFLKLSLIGTNSINLSRQHYTTIPTGNKYVPEWTKNWIEVWGKITFIATYPAKNNQTALKHASETRKIFLRFCKKIRAKHSLSANETARKIKSDQ
jgi:hypothetical protein